MSLIVTMLPSIVHADADGSDSDALDCRGCGAAHRAARRALNSTVEPISTPESFDGPLRPYRQRGVGWLVYLGRLGLGACFPDDMGLGKTDHLIATLAAVASEARLRELTGALVVIDGELGRLESRQTMPRAGTRARWLPAWGTT